MGEITCRFAIKYGVFHSQLIKEFRENDASYAIDSINTYFEASLFDSFLIYEVKSKYFFYVPTVGFVAIDIMTEVIYISIIETLTFCRCQHFSAIGSGKKLSIAVEQFEGVPLAWIM